MPESDAERCRRPRAPRGRRRRTGRRGRRTVADAAGEAPARTNWFFYGLGLSLQTFLWFLLFLALVVGDRRRRRAHRVPLRRVLRPRRDLLLPNMATDDPMTPAVPASAGEPAPAAPMTDALERLREWARDAPRRDPAAHARTPLHVPRVPRARRGDRRRSRCRRRRARRARRAASRGVRPVLPHVVRRLARRRRRGAAQRHAAAARHRLAPRQGAAGALVVPDEIAGGAGEGVPRLVVASDGDGLVAGLRRAPGRRRRRRRPEPATAGTEATGAAGLSPVRPDELAMILFTSGTTGVPKGACQTLRALSENPGLVAARMGLGPDDRVFINTPPYFTSGICHFLTMMAHGGGVAGQLGLLLRRRAARRAPRTRLHGVRRRARSPRPRGRAARGPPRALPALLGELGRPSAAARHREGASRAPRHPHLQHVRADRGLRAPLRAAPRRARRARGLRRAAHRRDARHGA